MELTLFFIWKFIFNFEKVKSQKIMQITVQLVDNNALGLLQYLEKLNIIRLLNLE
jgi:hypothetical protein